MQFLQPHFFYTNRTNSTLTNNSLDGDGINDVDEQGI
jgi:hypothetical protein